MNTTFFLDIMTKRHLIVAIKNYFLKGLYSLIGVILSDYDPSPKSLNEMMNFSLPVIVTSVTGTSEDLVKHGINGYIVNSGDIKSISKYIKNLAIDRNLARNMEKKSLEIVRGSTFVKDAIAIETASWIDS